MFEFLKREDINKGIEEFKSTEGAVLLDVRSKDEYQSGHVPGSKNIDVGKSQAQLQLSEIKPLLFLYTVSVAQEAVGL